jgi:hypothetical protein
MTTDRVVVQDAARRPSVDDNAHECAWHGAPNCRAYGDSGVTEDGRGKPGKVARAGWSWGGRARRRPRGKEARKEAIIEMLRERRDQEAERLKRLRAEVQVPQEVVRL